MLLRRRVVNTCAILLERMDEIPEWDLLIVVCHIVCVGNDISMYVFEVVYSSCRKMKMCELERKEKGGQVGRFIVNIRPTGKPAA